jgi:hypothetical protein
MSHYEKTIQVELARRGRPEVSPRWVEAWIRLELGVLNWLGKAHWRKEVGIALECIDSSTPEINEKLAASLLRPVHAKPLTTSPETTSDATKAGLPRISVQHAPPSPQRTA